MTRQEAGVLAKTAMGYERPETYKEDENGKPLGVMPCSEEELARTRDIILKAYDDGYWKGIHYERALHDDGPIGKPFHDW